MECCFNIMKVKDIKIGETYNNIQVLADLGTKDKGRIFLCKCLLCGKEYEVWSKHIGFTNACKECNAKSNIVNIAGRRYGRLIALEYMGRKNGRTLWRCQCDCGNETITGYSNLINGITRSCGCLNNEMRLINSANRRKCISKDFLPLGDLRQHPLFSTWSSMITRCYNPKRKNYVDYGGRGIKVCDEWQGDCGFENFIKDMGNRPSPKHSIDRIDVNGDYTPENCRWATSHEQSSNRTDNSYLFINKKKIIAKTLSDIIGMNYSTIAHQIQKGVDINLILKYKGVDLRTKEMRLIRDKCKNFNRVISEEFWHLIPQEVYDNLLNI